MHPIVKQKIASGHCICAPRGLSVDPRCPIHKGQATEAERRRYGLIPMDPEAQRTRGVMASQPAQPQWVCPRCKVDRFKEPCPGPHHACPMKADAHGVGGRINDQQENGNG